VKDFTISVYAPQSVTIVNAKGLTSDPTNGGTTNQANITSQLNRKTAAATTTTTSNAVTTTTTTTVTVPTVVTTPVTTVTVSANATALVTSLSTALIVGMQDVAAGSNSAFTSTNGGYYTWTKGYSRTNSTFFFG
jgi:hypothetical protein